MKIFGAMVLLLLAAVLGIVEVLTLADPVRAKMADDGDPFGDPHIPWAHHAGLVALIVALVAAAGLLLRPLRRK